MSPTNDPDAAALLLSVCARDATTAIMLPPPPHGRHSMVPGSPSDDALLLLAKSAILGQAATFDSGAFLPLILARLHQINQAALILQPPAAGFAASSPPFSPPALPIRTTSPSFSESDSRLSRLSSVDTISPGRSGAVHPTYVASGTSSPSATIGGCGEISVSSLLNARCSPAATPHLETFSLPPPATLGARKASPRAPRRQPAPAPRYWSEEEHERFLEGLKMFGDSDHFAIANLVGTRSPRQVRSHSQKFFKKVQA